MSGAVLVVRHLRSGQERAIFEEASTNSVLELAENGRIPRDSPNEIPAVRDASNGVGTYDIFEGTEQIQQLVIARAISGLRIE